MFKPLSLLLVFGSRLSGGTLRLGDFQAGGPDLPRRLGRRLPREPRNLRWFAGWGQPHHFADERGSPVISDQSSR